VHRVCADEDGADRVLRAPDEDAHACSAAGVRATDAHPDGHAYAYAYTHTHEDAVPGEGAAVGVGGVRMRSRLEL
jgi:hypothetical protein